MEFIFKTISVVTGFTGFMFVLLALVTEWANNAKRGTISIDIKMWLICGGCALLAFAVSYFSWR